MPRSPWFEVHKTDDVRVGAALLESAKHWLGDIRGMSTIRLETKGDDTKILVMASMRDANRIANWIDGYQAAMTDEGAMTDEPGNNT